MRNPAAHEALKEFCEDGLSRLRETVGAPDRLPMVHTLGSTTFSDTGYTAAWDWQVDWTQVMRDHLGDPASIGSWKQALAALRGDGKLAGREVTLEQPRVTVVDLLGRLMSQQGGLTFDEESFDKVYQETEDYFYRDTVPYRYLAPLTKFRMESEEIGLDEGLSIVKLPDGLRREILLEATGSSAVAAEMRDLTGIGYGLALYVDLQKERGPEAPYRCVGQDHGAIGTARDRFREVCAALRLFKAGGVGFEHVLPRPTCWVPSRPLDLWGGGARSAARVQYHLSRDEAAQFEDFWRWYRGCAATVSKTVLLALRRFNMAYARRSEEDRLVDFIIAFEALVLNRDHSKKRTLGARIAQLLGKDAVERADIRQEVEAAYEQRNNIVHEGEADANVTVGPASGVSLAELNVRVEERLRTAIRRVAELQPQYDKVGLIKELDPQAAKGAQSKGKTKKPRGRV